MKPILVLTLVLAACVSDVPRGAPPVGPGPIADNQRCCTGDACVLPHMGQKTCEPAETRTCETWISTTTSSPGERALWVCAGGAS